MASNKSVREATCQCKAVRLELPPLDKPQPELFHCHCSECRAQSSSAFGTTAIYPDFHLPVDTQPLGVWTRPTFNPATVKDCYFCTICGVRMVHRNRGVNDVREEAGVKGPKRELKEGAWLSIKGGCIPGLDWSHGKHIYCGDAVLNLEFPDNLEKYVEDDDSERWDHRRVQR